MHLDTGTAWGKEERRHAGMWVEGLSGEGMQEMGPYRKLGSCPHKWLQVSGVSDATRPWLSSGFASSTHDMMVTELLVTLQDE
jgi:hypothetical protein